jgi:hypothetical protein
LSQTKSFATKLNCSLALYRSAVKMKVRARCGKAVFLRDSRKILHTFPRSRQTHRRLKSTAKFSIDEKSKVPRSSSQSVLDYISSHSFSISINSAQHASAADHTQSQGKLRISFWFGRKHLLFLPSAAIVSLSSIDDLYFGSHTGIKPHINEEVTRSSHIYFGTREKTISMREQL